MTYIPEVRRDAPPIPTTVAKDVVAILVCDFGVDNAKRCESDMGRI